MLEKTTPLHYTHGDDIEEILLHNATLDAQRRSSRRSHVIYNNDLDYDSLTWAN